MIPAWEKGLVFKNGSYKRMLSSGKHWLGFGEQVMIYNMARVFAAPCELNILLKDKAVEDALTVVEVKDNEIALRFEGIHFKEVLTPGRYAYWKGFDRLQV